MATPDELRIYNQQKELLDRSTKVIKAAFENNKFGSDFRKLAKELLPDIELPEDKLAPFIEPVREQAETLKAELAEMKKLLKEREEKDVSAKTEADMKAALEAARSKFNLTEEGFKLMTERMVATKNYSDAEAAAAWVAAQNPPQKPEGPAWGANHLDLFGVFNKDESREELHRNPEKWTDKMLNEFVRDPDAFVRASLAA